MSDKTRQSRFARKVLDLSRFATGVLCGATLLSLLARHWWLSDLLANLRMQLLIGCGAVFVPAALLRRSRMAFLLIACSCWHISHLRSSALVPVADNRPAIITVTTANVLTVNQRHEEIAAELLRSDADVIAVIELSSSLQEHLSGSFSQTYPWQRVMPQDRGNFGIGLYSRIPFESADFISFNSTALTSIAAEIRRDGQSLHLIATHTLPPMGPGSFQHRNEHLQQVAERVNELRRKQPESHAIVMGDLNLTPWSPVYGDFLKQAELRSAPHGLTPTWYRFRSFPFGLILDHVLSTSNLACSEYRVGSDVGSDHRFVTASFVLESESR